MDSMYYIYKLFMKTWLNWSELILNWMNDIFKYMYLLFIYIQVLFIILSISLITLYVMNISLLNIVLIGLGALCIIIDIEILIKWFMYELMFIQLINRFVFNINN